MNTSYDKQIDALLRSRAAENRASESFAVHDDANHLDADALNAFAENSLPPVARTAYVAHLAACDECRQQLAQFARISSTKIAAKNVGAHISGAHNAAYKDDSYDEVQHAAASNFWRKFTLPFASASPATYVLATLALMAFSVILFVSLRDNTTPNLARQEPRIATNANLNTNANRGAQSDADSQIAAAMSSNTMSANMNGASAASSESIASNANRQGANANQIASTDATAKMNSNAANADAVQLAESKTIAELPLSGRSANTLQLAPSSAELSANDAAVALANPAQTVAEAITVAPPVTTTTRNEADAQLKSNKSRNESAGQTAANNFTIAPPKAAPTARDSSVAPPATLNAPAVPRPLTAKSRAAIQSGDERARAACSTNEANSTRTVAGRMFTRQGDVWIDAAYRTPTRLISVRRNSEQFRALVADEPSLRNIAQQLAGSVIVVLNKQAYRLE